jgi:hypothetical protein
MLEAELFNAPGASERNMLEQLPGRLSTRLLASEAGAPYDQLDKSP